MSCLGYFIFIIKKRWCHHSYILHVLFLYFRSFLENKLHCQQKMICQLIGGSLLVSGALNKVNNCFKKGWKLWSFRRRSDWQEIFAKFGAVILKTSKQKDLDFCWKRPKLFCKIMQLSQKEAVQSTFVYNNRTDTYWLGYFYSRHKNL